MDLIHERNNKGDFKAGYKPPEDAGKNLRDVVKDWKEIRELLLKKKSFKERAKLIVESPMVIERLCVIFFGQADYCKPSDSLRAFEFLAYYGLGKPKETIEIEDQRPMRLLNNDQLLAVAQNMIVQIKGQDEKRVLEDKADGGSAGGSGPGEATGSVGGDPAPQGA